VGLFGDPLLGGRVASSGMFSMSSANLSSPPEASEKLASNAMQVDNNDKAVSLARSTKSSLQPPSPPAAADSASKSLEDDYNQEDTIPVNSGNSSSMPSSPAAAASSPAAAPFSPAAAPSSPAAAPSSPAAVASSPAATPSFPPAPSKLNLDSSSQPSSPPDEDAVMLAVSSTVSSLDLDRDDAQMVVIESNDHNDEDTVMVGVQSNADLSHTEEDDGNAVGPESIDPLGLLSDLSDMDEDDVKSQAESDFEGDSSKSKRRSMDVESLVQMAISYCPQR
jgi:hypothetical protein